jgi:hypothetical protein
MKIFRKKGIGGVERQPDSGKGLILFKEVSEAMTGEKILRKQGMEVRLVAPPRELRMGCDLALEIDLIKQVEVERSLREGQASWEVIAPLEGKIQRPLDIIKTVDFGGSIMVRAGNMKITFDKGNGVILNISGGGCPDVPYLHIQLLGKTLTEAPRPRDIGYTLCALMLDRAFEEALKMLRSKDASDCWNSSH